MALAVDPDASGRRGAAGTIATESAPPYSATIDDNTPLRWTYTIQGPSGARAFNTAYLDLFIDSILGDKGKLVVSAEVTADPVLFLFDYSTPCNPCAPGENVVQLPFQPYHSFSGPNPWDVYQPFVAGGNSCCFVHSLGIDGNGFLTGTIRGSVTSMTTFQDISVTINYTWPGVMISNVPEPSTFALLLTALTIVPKIKRKRA